MHILKLESGYINIDNVDSVYIGGSEGLGAVGSVYVRFGGNVEPETYSGNEGVRILEYMEHNAENIEYCPDVL